MKVYLFTGSSVDQRNVLTTPYHLIFKTKERALEYFAQEEATLMKLGYVFKEDTTNHQFIVQKDYARADDQVRFSVAEHEVIK